MGRSKPAVLVFSLPLLTSPSLLQLDFFIRTSNFGFEAERTSLSLRSEAENFLKMFLNLHGIRGGHKLSTTNTMSPVSK